MSPFGPTGLATGIAAGAPLTGVIAQGVSGASNAALNQISAWVLDGTKGALRAVAGAIGASTAPSLESTWFSSTYWRVAALAAMLTLPFLCAAAVQAIARGDIGLLARAAFAHLPLAAIGVSLAAPLTMLMLAATDQMSAAVSTGALASGAGFLDRTAVVAGVLSDSATGSAFFAMSVGLLALAAALALAVELTMRAAAVYVVVLMLPLAFAAFVWPARRVWATRTVELLVSLILSKFAIVAVLSLAAAAFSQRGGGVGQLLVAMTLLLLSTLAPWALMRLLPFAELAAGTAGMLHGELIRAQDRAGSGMGELGAAGDHIASIPARLHEQARQLSAPGERPAEAGAGADHDDAADPPRASAERAATATVTPTDTASAERAAPARGGQEAPEGGPFTPADRTPSWSELPPERLGAQSVYDWEELPPLPGSAPVQEEEL